MPVDLELILSASPPHYAYSAFVDGRYTQFTSESFASSDSYDHGYTVSKKNYINSRRLQSQLSRSTSSDEESQSGDEPSDRVKPLECAKQRRASILLSDKPREKKKVSFADDKGLALVEIRNIPESPSLATRWARDFLSAFTNVIAQKPVNENKWKIAFPNPPYNASATAEKLEKNFVSLESLEVSEGDDDVMMGIVRVKNVAFEKEVFVRVTFDRWSNYEDIIATYDTMGLAEEGVEELKSYDAFTFSALIKPLAHRYEVVEFCICYRANDKEYWDNNGGVNYRLVSTAAGKAYKTSREVSQIMSNSHERSSKAYTSISDRFNPCPEMDPWKTFFCDQPYW